MQPISRLTLGLLALLWATAASAGGKPGDFDYYLLSLGWSPSWCATAGDRRGDPQCDAGTGFAFTLHGLWPQYEQGWPSDCQSGRRPPTRAETAAMADIMGSAGLAWHEWQKHGSCSGQDAPGYFALARWAYQSVTVPPELEHLGRDIRLPPDLVVKAFRQANPALPADGIQVTCTAGRIEEVRICLTKDLMPRACGSDVGQGCGTGSVLMEKVR